MVNSTSTLYPTLVYATENSKAVVLVRFFFFFFFFFFLFFVVVFLFVFFCSFCFNFCGFYFEAFLVESYLGPISHVFFQSCLAL